MCGRYTLSTPAGRLAEEFELNSAVEISPSYNVAPTQQVAAVLEDEAGRRLEVLRWGLIPPWADDPGIGSRMINARSETAPEKPSFRRAFRERRCLIPADGFYEWQRDERRQATLLHPHGGRAALRLRRALGELEQGRRRGAPDLHDPHHRGQRPGGRDPRPDAGHPGPDAYDVWLDPDSERDELTGLIAPYPEDEMEAYPVSRFVNSPSNNDPRCIEPAA